jgi:hypothetical protein
MYPLHHACSLIGAVPYIQAHCNAVCRELRSEHARLNARLGAEGDDFYENHKATLEWHFGSKFNLELLAAAQIADGVVAPGTRVNGRDRLVYEGVDIWISNQPVMAVGDEPLEEDAQEELRLPHRIRAQDVEGPRPRWVLRTCLRLPIDPVVVDPANRTLADGWPDALPRPALPVDERIYLFGYAAIIDIYDANMPNVRLPVWSRSVALGKRQRMFECLPLDVLQPAEAS